jgi:hypothetical protein
MRPNRLDNYFNSIQRMPGGLAQALKAKLSDD